MEKDIIQEFIDATPHWAEMITTQQAYYRPQQDSCFVCGVDPSKLLELAKVLKDDRRP